MARGLSLRLDHGSQHLADYSQNQIRYWGIAPSFARVFRNAEEVRAAVAAFVETYNACWRLEKLGFMAPREARESFQPALAA